ncbi:MAG: ATP-dependent DNA helicase RecG [Lachnospiraceae bacterium]|nr:ATP-dependent DNA helicase RecG [Lachnospiraceae bacterium]
MHLQSDITTIKGVGEKSATLFHKLHIETVKDLLFFFPRDYETFEEPATIADIQAGELCTVRGMVTGQPLVKQVRNLKILTVTVRDATGSMQLTFFNMPFLKNTLKSGQFYLFRGTAQVKGQRKKAGIEMQPAGLQGSPLGMPALVMEQPRIYKEDEYKNLMAFIQPRYSLTKGLTNLAVTKAVKQILSLCPMPEDILPKELLEKENLMSYKEALCAIHFPESREQLIKARERLVFNEFFFFLLLLRDSKAATMQEKNHTPMLETAETVRFIEALPYKLTNAQLKVIEEIKADMTGEHVMSRLVQGDVGSGKTIVAFWALLLSVTNGYQGALMAPTEVLAVQHYENILSLTKKYNLPFKTVLLTGSQTASAKREAYKALEEGSANLVIGTHAVIQDKVHFKNLALVVTDEQHRFGVRQRENLKSKGNHPHVLVMSATPIPRTLAIILYGDLQISIIDELPSGRKAIKNCVVGPSYRPKAYEFIAKEVNAGRQVYCICPMVEEGEMDDLENVVEYTEKLRAALPASIQVSYLHGKMRPADKNRIMESFGAGEIDVLVSTTVIEVGINVPNATVMMVENAERFGLAQLHQLRGRVGRGEHQSYCIFINTKENKETKERLEILNRSNDGFFIAGEDLRLRGPGDLFGIRQSGDLAFKLGDIYTDAGILKRASEAAEKWAHTLRENGVVERYLTQAENGLLECVDFTTI